ncbi:hypothetical protein H310_07386 [Aphanomyces invadans]|uniref:Uncharacterized protein n=1 Tax=Aphanomyces invadans TaxID=157072 RepID=A0A024U3P6_9STRA|nr:hypothetical protein H310_07386 [Aphanomyces invadans]ETW00864.1 hypothetical protein H310_07386 [Aphanomyces invadans]|eukprot:XP_008870999.1 hypothetical protein H310_07386 [Aphanomyces invadans]
MLSLERIARQASSHVAKLTLALATNLDDATSKSSDASAGLGWLQPKREGGVWWPVFAHGPVPLKSNSTSGILDDSCEATETSVYSFGTYKFAIHPVVSFKPWRGFQPVRSNWRLGRSSNVYRQALAEVESFLKQAKAPQLKDGLDAKGVVDIDLHVRLRSLATQDRSDNDEGVEAAFAAHSIVWAKVPGYPWLPQPTSSMFTSTTCHEVKPWRVHHHCWED